MCVQYVCTLLAVGSMEGVAHGYELWWGYPEKEGEKSQKKEKRKKGKKKEKKTKKNKREGARWLADHAVVVA